MSTTIINNHHRMFEPTVNLLMAFAAVASAVLAFASVNLPSSFSEYQVLFCLCFAGGIGGGIVSVMVFPLDTLRKTAFKWISSSTAAGLFSPAICQWFQIHQNIPYVLALSAACGLFAWGVLLVVVPLFGTKGVVWYLIRRFFNIDLQEIQNQEQREENKSTREDNEYTPDYIDRVRRKR